MSIVPDNNTDLDTSIIMVIEGLGGAMSQVQPFHFHRDHMGISYYK